MSKPIRLTAENFYGARHVLEFVGWTETGQAKLIGGSANYEADPATGRVICVAAGSTVLRLVPSAWRRLKLMARALRPRCRFCGGSGRQPTHGSLKYLGMGDVTCTGCDGDGEDHE